MNKLVSFLIIILFSTFFLEVACASDYTSLSNSLTQQEKKHTTPFWNSVSDKPITWEQLVKGKPVTGLTKNSRFAAPDHAHAPTIDFIGTLELAGAQMSMSPGFNMSIVHNKDVTAFPSVSIKFFTVGTHLVPTTQNIIPNGTLKGTRSYWDIIVQPGRVWHDSDDHGWNRASFPFALVNRLEGETHTGIATFLYTRKRVSHVRFQIVAETAPYDVSEYFNAWGTANASYEPGGIDHLEQRKFAYISQVQSRFPTAPLSKLKGKVDPHILEGFDGATNDKEKAQLLQTGLFYNGVLYTSPCNFTAGPFPYCNEIRYGIWSVSKSAMLDVEMLRLAEKYDSNFIHEPIANYVPRARRKGWSDVTFLDLANMASGHGPEGDPTCYLCDYKRWYLAPSETEKTIEALNYPRAWAPGTKYNYRDQDAFLLSVALEKYLQSKEGKGASLGQMLRKEVYEPIGIYNMPATHTIETNGSPGHLISLEGYLPTLDDLTKIALLFANHGSWNGDQILDRKLVDSLLPSKTPPKLGLPKAAKNTFGTKFYALNWHITPYRSTEGCRRYLPAMHGWGGQRVIVMPGPVIGLRIANHWSAEPSSMIISQAKVANQLVSLCNNHDESSKNSDDYSHNDEG